MEKVSVVFSFYNEQENIPELVRRTTTTLHQAIAAKEIGDFELIFVDDASTDSSFQMLQDLRKEHPQIKIARMSRNFGVSACVMAGFSLCTGGLIAYLDADLQDPPELMLEMLTERRKHNADIVHTVRKSRDGETAIKLAITKLGYWILAKISDIEVVPNSGDYKLMTRRVLKEILRHQEKNPFMRALVSSIGFKQIQIFYRREPRFSGETKFPIFSMRVINNFLNSALISYSDKPLKFLSIGGGLIALISFLLMISVLVGKILGTNIPGWTAIMVTITFFSGMQFLGLGVLGLYLHGIFLESKNRPVFIIDESIGF